MDLFLLMGNLFIRQSVPFYFIKPERFDQKFREQLSFNTGNNRRCQKLLTKSFTVTDCCPGFYKSKRTGVIYKEHDLKGPSHDSVE